MIDPVMGTAVIGNKFALPKASDMKIKVLDPVDAGMGCILFAAVALFQIFKDPKRAVTPVLPVV